MQNTTVWMRLGLDLNEYPMEGNDVDELLTRTMKLPSDREYV